MTCASSALGPGITHVEADSRPLRLVRSLPPKALDARRGCTAAKGACLAARCGFGIATLGIGSLGVGNTAFAAGNADSTSTSSRSESPASVAVTINAAGFALFGPDLNVEFGSQYTGMLRLRGFGLGLLSHSMFTPEDNRHLGLDSFAIGAAGRA